MTTTIVQKYGGTSVGTGERIRAVAGIVAHTKRKHDVVAVVSAMSGTTKKEGTTSLLLDAATAAVHGDSFRNPLRRLERNHHKAIREAVENPDLRNDVIGFVTEELDRLSNFLRAIQVIRELSARSQDIVMGTGERLSARLLTASLRDLGVPAVYTDLSRIVKEGEREANPAFFRRLQRWVSRACTPGHQTVPVVTGFVGMVPGGLLRAVGRGYSDFTAALIAAGLGPERVEEMQVWKEVDGVFTADPKRVPNARPLPRISPVETSELTYFGSEVLHPLTMERVVSAKVPIRIKNTFAPEKAGTVIVPGERRVSSKVTAVTAKSGITIVTVQSNRMYDAYGFMARVFQALADLGVVVDLVSTSEVSVSFTLDRAEHLRDIRNRLKAFGSVTVETGRAIVSVVGEGMKYQPGTAGQMFSALGKAGVNIEMISQGASEINISCVIRQEDAEKGLQAVHRVFLE